MDFGKVHRVFKGILCYKLKVFLIYLLLIFLKKKEKMKMKDKFEKISKKWRLENSLKTGCQTNVWRFDRRQEILVDERLTSIDKGAFQFSPTLSLIYACNGIYFDDITRGDFLVALIKEEINTLFFINKESRPNQSLSFFLPFLQFDYRSRSGLKYVVECRHDKFRLEFPAETSLNIIEGRKLNIKVKYKS